MNDVESSQLLSGIRVLDIGQHVSGPFCAKLLGDYGAEVIKIEPPDGDPLRRVGPFAPGVPEPESSLTFLYVNQNKRGMVLDLGTEAGRQAVATLAKDADVVVENLGPRALDSIGIGYQELRLLNPGLVVTSISNFGAHGPYQDYQAEDINIFALSGLMYHSGEAEREPLHANLLQAHYVGGLNGAIGTLAALVNRMFTNQGDHVDVSLAECLSCNLVQAVPAYAYTGAIRGRRPSTGASLEEIMPCKDGFVVPSAQGSQPFEVVAKVLGEEELLDPRFGTNEGRRIHGAEMDALIAQGLSSKERVPLFHDAAQQRLVFGMVQDMDDLYSCPHLRERGFFVDVQHSVAGKASYAGPIARVNEGGFQARRPAPRLGEHTEEVLAVWGLDTGVGEGTIRAGQSKPGSAGGRL